MELLIQQIFNGLALGSIYALFGLGFGLVFSTLGILNMAHGTFATWGALVALWLMNTGVPFWLAALGGMLAAGVIGVLVDELAFQPLRRRGSVVIPSLITSIGCMIVLAAVARIATDAKTSRFPMDSWGAVQLGSFRLSWERTLAIAMLIVVCVLLYVLMRHTRLGLGMRAVGLDESASSIAGVNGHVVIAFTAFLAAAIAGLAGILLGLTTNTVSYQLGDSLLLKGFAAVVVGGVGDARGTAIAGLLIGVAEVLTVQYGSATYQDVVTFGLLMIFLAVRPQGIFKTYHAVTRA